MDLDELRAFIAVADTGSFSAAAKSLKFAGATLKQRIDKIETRSGVELLKRAKDGASMTRAGEVLAEKGRSILKETRLLLEAVRSLESQDNDISIEIPFGLPPHLEQSAYKALRKAAPALGWKISYSSGPFTTETQATFALHIGAAPAASNDWRHTRVASIRTGLFASEAYLKKNGTPQNADELLRHPLHVWERHDRSPRQLPLKNSSPLDIKPAIVSPSAYLIRQLALGGEGISFAPSSAIAGFLEPRENPVAVLRDEIQDDFDVWFSVRRHASAGAIGVLATAIVRFAQATLRPLDEGIQKKR